MLVLLASRSLGSFDREEKLIGWRGEVPNDGILEPEGTWMETIAWRPRAFIIHNLISAEEARHIVNEAWPQMQRSTVVGDNGSSVLDDYRTSYGTFLNRYQTDIVKRMEDRVAFFTHLPVSHQEDVQVLRYGIGQYYQRHQDSLDNDSPRMATVLVYLSDPEEGGETSFPELSEWAHPEMAHKYGSKFSECAKGHVAFRPKMGDALLFWSYSADGRTDDIASTHEGCPVLRGAKWTTTIWIHTLPFRPEEYDARTNRFRQPAPFKDPGLCFDSGGPACAGWAKSGECEKNEHFMKGNGLDLGNCMKSCGVCEPCDKGDTPCIMNNRKKIGFLAFDPSELDYRRLE